MYTVFSRTVARWLCLHSRHLCTLCAAWHSTQLPHGAPFFAICKHGLSWPLFCIACASVAACCCIVCCCKACGVSMPLGVYMLRCCQLLLGLRLRAIVCLPLLLVCVAFAYNAKRRRRYGFVTGTRPAVPLCCLLRLVRPVVLVPSSRAVCRCVPCVLPCVLVCVACYVACTYMLYVLTANATTKSMLV